MNECNGENLPSSCGDNNEISNNFSVFKEFLAEPRRFDKRLFNRNNFTLKYYKSILQRTQQDWLVYVKIN